jgi:hypothetical protein
MRHSSTDFPTSPTPKEPGGWMDVTFSDLAEFGRKHLVWLTARAQRLGCKNLLHRESGIEKVLLSLQTRYWKNRALRAEKYLKCPGVMDLAGSQLTAEARKLFAQSGWKSPHKKFSNQWGGIDTVMYPWTADTHQVPDLRNALGVSRSTMWRMRRKLGIISEGDESSGLAGHVSFADAMLLLTERFGSRRTSKNQRIAETIWPRAKQDRAPERVAALRRILRTTGAPCK